MSRFHHIAESIADLVAEKNAAYGSSFAKAGAAMRLLYPAGIMPEQMDDALLIVRIWDKLQRIATDRDALGESPYRDIAGYGILGVHLHESKQSNGHAQEKDQCASASVQAVESSSKTTIDSAVPNAGKKSATTLVGPYGMPSGPEIAAVRNVALRTSPDLQQE